MYDYTNVCTHRSLHIACVCVYFCTHVHVLAHVHTYVQACVYMTEIAPKHKDSSLLPENSVISSGPLPLLCAGDDDAPCRHPPCQARLVLFPVTDFTEKEARP